MGGSDNRYPGSEVRDCRLTGESAVAELVNSDIGILQPSGNNQCVEGGEVHHHINNK